MNAAYLLMGFVFGLMIGYLIVTRKHKSRFLAMAEYWVYLPGDKLPVQDEIMTLMVRNNPYHRRGVSPIGPAEGLVFSDVRLHMALVKRAINPHVFRPDLFHDDVEVSGELIDDLGAAQSLVKIRFASELELKDKRHLQFLIHAADAVAELGSGNAIFDVQAEILMPRERLRTVLQENFDATLPELHSRIVWKATGATATAETRGLAKIGLKDWQTPPMDADQRVLATSVLSEAIRTVWEKQSLPDFVEVSTFDDTFQVLFQLARNKMTTVRILRVQAT